MFFSRFHPFFRSLTSICRRKMHISEQTFATRMGLFNFQAKKSKTDSNIPLNQGITKANLTPIKCKKTDDTYFNRTKNPPKSADKNFNREEMVSFDAIRFDFDAIRFRFGAIRFCFDGLSINFDGLRINLRAIRLRPHAK